MALKIHKNGVTREMTPEEEAAHIAQQQADAATRAAEEAALRVPRIKEAAEALILSIYPMWKQSNMHRDGVTIPQHGRGSTLFAQNQTALKPTPA